MTTNDLPVRHMIVDAPADDASGIPTSDQGHTRVDTRDTAALVGLDAAAGAVAQPAPHDHARPSLFDPGLYMLASLLDDIEGSRKANCNRVRILTTTEPDEDGVMRGFGLDATHPAVATLNALATQLDALEHGTILALNRAMRSHPLAAFQKQAKGVGEKQLARLLAAIGDPYLRTLPDGTTQPRTVSQLWAYCGLHTLPGGQKAFDAQAHAAAGASLPGGAMPDAQTKCHAPLPVNVAAKRQKGVRANWSSDAKTRAYLIATSCIKQTGEYRAVYDRRREATAVSHPDWTPGHSHNDALRVVSKRILRDLWRAARDYYHPELVEESGQAA